MSSDVRVCPNCGSHRITLDRSDMLSVIGLQQSYRCEDCDYSGIFPEVDADDVADYKQEAVERGPDIDVDITDRFNRGRFLIGVVMVLVGVGALFAGTFEGFLTGALSALIGATLVFEQARNRFNV